MRLVRWQRIAWEIGLGLLALVAAAAVLVPSFFVVNLIFRSGLYSLLIATVGGGVLLLLYQARLRPTLREPAMRAAAGIAEALRSNQEQAQAPPSRSAFRVWGGVPIASLRASLHSAQHGAQLSAPRGTAQVTPTALAEALCVYVRSRAADSPTLTWALSEVGGDRFLLLAEPEQPGDPLRELTGMPLASRTWEGTFYHLWSANGPASYEEPVAFATVLLVQAVAGKEAELHQLAVGLAERVAGLPDISGVEVLRSETKGSPPYLLWLAAGRDRTVRRRVYLVLESASATEGLAWSIDRFDLLACDAYAALEEPAALARETA